jgi:hypothetical protein
MPVKVGLETETELAPLPVNVIDWLLGPKVICAASAAVPQSATNVIAVRNFVAFMFTVLQKGNVSLSIVGPHLASTVPRRFFVVLPQLAYPGAFAARFSVKTGDRCLVKAGW